MNKYEIEARMKFNAEEVESLINKVVPIVAAEEDYDFFKGALWCKAQECNSAEFSVFISNMLKQFAGETQ